jgi:hypothetical protein
VTHPFFLDASAAGAPALDGYAATFDGSSAGHGFIATVGGLSVSTNMAWVYSGPTPVINHSVFASGSGLEQWWITSGGNLVIRANNTEKTISIAAETWYHVCTQWLSSSTPIYINGSLVDTVAAGAAQLTGSTSHLWGQDDGPDNTFKGTIYDPIRMTGQQAPSAGNFSSAGGGEWKDVTGYSPGANDYRILNNGGVKGEDLWGMNDFTESSGGTVTLTQALLPPGA